MVAAELLTGGQCNWETMPWHGLWIQHMDALRSELADQQEAHPLLPVLYSYLVIRPQLDKKQRYTPVNQVRFGRYPPLSATFP
jgi:hypothetical protein